VSDLCVLAIASTDLLYWEVGRKKLELVQPGTLPCAGIFFERFTMTTLLQDFPITDNELSANEIQLECKARANIYRLLAGVFLQEPSADYINAMRSPEVAVSLRDMGVVFDNDFNATPLHELQEVLACEYAVLFLVAGGCPPVESVRLTGRYQQQPFFEVHEYYQKAGFQVVGERFAIFDDQLGVELSFLAELLERSATALAGGDTDKYAQITKDIKRFWVQHPGKWARGYAALLTRAAEHSFYREMAKLLGSFAEWEINLLGLKIDDLDGGKLKVPKAEIEYEFDPDEPVCNSCEKGQSATTEDNLHKIDISLIEARLQGTK